MLRLLVFAVILPALMLPARAHADTADKLAALRDKARPILVLSDIRADPRVAAQIAKLDRAKPDLDERNVRVLREAVPDSVLRKRLGVPARGFAVVLIGKDGSVKKVWREPVEPKAIFTLIDAMPMRRDEMRG